MYEPRTFSTGVLELLDVPAAFSKYTLDTGTSGTREFITNPLPLEQPNPGMASADAHQLLYDLAVQDGWTALYDPTNEDSLIYSGADIIGIKDSLGNYPDLMSHNLLSPGDFSPFDLFPKGAIKMGGGLVGAEFDIPENVSALGLSFLGDDENFINFMVFIGFMGDFTSEISSAAVQAINTPAFGGDPLSLVSAAKNQVGTLKFGVQTGGQIWSFNSIEGDFHLGYRPLPGFDELEEEEEYIVGPPTGVSTGFSWASLAPSDGNNGFGPLFLMEGDISAEQRNRATKLLSQLSGVPVGLPPGTPDEPTAYVTLDENGNPTVSHLPHMPMLLASVVKILTCYAAREWVTEGELDNLLTLTGPEVSSNPPTLNEGDQITWGDAFYLSLIRSHNYVTQNIAHHAGLLSGGSGTPDFINMVQNMIDGWGWQGAEYVNAQGQGSTASAKQIAELLLRIKHEDPWLYDVMGTWSKTVTIYRQGSPTGETFVADSINPPSYSGQVLFPELVAAKSGSLSGTKTLAQTWNNPITGEVNASVTLQSPDNTPVGGRRSQRQLLDHSTYLSDPPRGYVPSPNTVLGWQEDAVSAINTYDTRDEALSFSPFDPSEAPRPLVREGDEILFTGELTRRSSSPLSLFVDVYVNSVLEHSLPVTVLGSWSPFSLTLTVPHDGFLDVQFNTKSLSSTPVILVRNLNLEVTTQERERTVYPLYISNFSYTESSQSHDSADSSGTVGDFSVDINVPLEDSVISEYGEGYLRNKPVRLRATYGDLYGTITSVSRRDEHSLCLTGVSGLAPLNAFNIVAPPYSGSLVGLFERYFSLVGSAAPEFSVHPDLLGRTITAPGWKGELWYHLKLLAAAERLQISLTPNGGVYISPTSAHNLDLAYLTNMEVSHVEQGLAQAVEVYTYNNQWVENQLIYPAGGWHEEVEVLSVNAGEEAEQVLELSASLQSFVTPQMVEYVGQHDISSSVYTIVGDDGFPVKPSQWEDAGGKISFELGEDTRSITVKMVGAVGIIGDTGEPINSFALALSSDTSGAQYSTLRILGTGVVFRRKAISFPTGVSEHLTGTDVGATIDNPFLSTLGQAAQAGALAAYKMSGAVPTLTDTSLGHHGGKWGSDILSGKMVGHNNNFRVRTATYTPESVSVTAEYNLTYDDVKFTGTYNDFELENAGLTYDDVQARGKNYG